MTNCTPDITNSSIASFLAQVEDVLDQLARPGTGPLEPGLDLVALSFATMCGALSAGFSVLEPAAAVFSSGQGTSGPASEPTDEPGVSDAVKPFAGGPGDHPCIGKEEGVAVYYDDLVNYVPGFRSLCPSADGAEAKVVARLLDFLSDVIALQTNYNTAADIGGMLSAMSIDFSRGALRSTAAGSFE